MVLAMNVIILKNSAHGTCIFVMFGYSIFRVLANSILLPANRMIHRMHMTCIACF